MHDTTWWTPYRTIGQVKLLHVDLRPDAGNEEVALGWLSEEEVRRWEKFRAELPRRQYVLCRGALRANLNALLNCQNNSLGIGYLNHGKPYALVDGCRADIEFNLSHSRQHGLIAFSRCGRVGVDVEATSFRPGLRRVIEDVFGSEERKELAATPHAELPKMFFRLWTMKEALMKAEGSGFVLGASSFEIPRSMLKTNDSGEFRFPQDKDTFWRLNFVGDARFAAAVASEISPQSK